MSKESLRAATLGKRSTFEKRKVEIDGVDFEVRQPTIEQRGKIRSKAMLITGGEVEFDMFAFLMCAVVELTYVPETDDRVYSEEDYDALGRLPAGGWFDKLTKEASELCNVEDVAVKKPSPETASES